MTQINTYNGRNSGTFYIQSKGNHAGRPLKDPIPNCFVVSTDVENAFERAYALFVSGAYKRDIIGSVIPFIHKRNVERQLIPELQSHFSNLNQLEAVRLMDENIAIMKEKIRLMEQMKIAMAKKYLKK
jgi:hypothetical protein